MNVVCYQSSRIGMVPPFTSQTLRHILFPGFHGLHLSVVVNRTERRESSKSTTLKSNKTVKVCRSAKKWAQLFGATKSFQKQKNCRTRRCTLNKVWIDRMKP